MALLTCAEYPSPDRLVASRYEQKVVQHVKKSPPKKKNNDVISFLFLIYASIGIWSKGVQISGDNWISTTVPL